MAKADNRQQQEEYLLSPLNNPMVNYTVYIPQKWEKNLYTAGLIIAGGLVGLLFFGGQFKSEGESTLFTYIFDVIIFVGIGLLVKKLFYNILLERKKNKRDSQLRGQFRDMLESLSASLSAGANVSEAFSSAYLDVKQQYGDEAMIVREMREITDGMNQNISISVMLSDFAYRSGNYDIKNFGDIFSICMEKGGDLKAVIRRTSGIIKDKISINEEIETKLTSNKTQHTIMSLMPIGIVAMLKFTNDTFAAAFTSLSGALVNIVAIGIFIGAYMLGRKITDIQG